MVVATAAVGSKFLDDSCHQALQVRVFGKRIMIKPDDPVEAASILFTKKHLYLGVVDVPDNESKIAHYYTSGIKHLINHRCLDTCDRL